MADRPMKFSAAMVLALLDGRKTQTRRVLPKAHPKFPEYTLMRRDVLLDPRQLWFWDGVHENVGASLTAPYAPGDRLWVQETWGMKWPEPSREHVIYRADGLDLSGWRSPILMPRWASRLTLTVANVRVQRVQEISEADAIAEGVDAVTMDDVPRQAAMSRRADFAGIWNSIHGPGAWDRNEWIAALTFTVERRNIDAKEDA